jgi:hypothetical protein
MSDTQEQVFGECPICKGNDGFLVVGNESWLICETHKTKWYAGEDLFPDFAGKNQERWEANRLRLLDYCEVEPYQPEEEQMIICNLSISIEEDRLMKIWQDPAASDNERVSAVRLFFQSLRNRNFKFDKQPTLTSTRVHTGGESPR